MQALGVGLAVAASIAREQVAALRRHAVRLARLTAAEIRERNRQHVAPSLARAHRTANRYTFALSSRSRGA